MQSAYSEPLPDYVLNIGDPDVNGIRHNKDICFRQKELFCKISGAPALPSPAGGEKIHGFHRPQDPDLRHLAGVRPNAGSWLM